MGEERRDVLRLAELPGWLRRTLGWLYLAWVLLVTAFAARVATRSLGFHGEVEPTIEMVVLLAGLLVAPLLPFAQRLFFPGGGGVDLAEKTRAAGFRAEVGIANAAMTSELPPLDLWSEEENAND